MASIRKPNSRVHATGRIRDILGLEALRKDAIPSSDSLREISDPFIKFVLNQYMTIEKKRAEFFKMYRPILEGSGIHVSNCDNALEDVPADECFHNSSDSTPRKKMNDLSFEMVASKFAMHISEAAKELQVSETTLSLWCRLSDIPHWPYRKIRSIDFLVTNMKGFERKERFGDMDVEDAIKLLEEEKEAIKKNPSLPLKKTTSVMIKKMHYLLYKREREMKNKG